jgi:hypothetical protein
MVMTKKMASGAEQGVADEIIENENRLVVRAHGLTRETEAYLRDYLKKVLQQTGREDLVAALQIILKELTTNAAKANFKKIFFAEHELRLDDPEHYEHGVERFRETFSEESFVEYRQKAQASDLLILITIDYDPDRIILEIRNNVPMTREEEKRAREKLRLAMSYEDMGQFITDFADETEGAGLGIMLCLTSMRSSSINPRLLSISTDFRTHTLARVEVPLHEGYIPTRMRYAQRRQSA